MPPISQIVILKLRLGFLLCLQYVLRLKLGSLLWCGLPCSLHVWISRGTSGKSRANPRGVNESGVTLHECVGIANCIAARFGLIAVLCLVRQVWWAIEQPVSSVAMWLPYLELALYPARLILGFQASMFQKLTLDCM